MPSFRLFPNGYAQDIPSAIISVDDSQATEARSVILTASAYYDHMMKEPDGKVEYIKAQLDNGGILYVDLLEQGEQIYL